MNSGSTLQIRLFILAVSVLLFGTIGLSRSAEAAIAKNIVNASNGDLLGSIVFPGTAGSTPEGVTLEFSADTHQFTQADITAISWDWSTPSLSLTAVTGTLPCNSPADGPCSKTTLTLTLQSFSIGTISCPPPPPPGQGSICSGQETILADIEFIDAAPAYACQRFEPPLADGPVTVRGNRALPLKAELLDQDGSELTGADLNAPPVVQVTYQPAINATPTDVGDAVVSVGRGTIGNAFAFSGSKWQFNLSVRNYTAPGTYTITMASGDEAEYRVDPTCKAQFIVNR
jgi:hypothetical protein